MKIIVNSVIVWSATTLATDGWLTGYSEHVSAKSDDSAFTTAEESSQASAMRGQGSQTRSKQHRWT